MEARHYHRHVGPWPDIRQTSWLQWTASPPSVADLDRDGRNEVIGLPNVERKEPYETQAYAFMVLDGAHGKGKRSARRHRGFVTPPLTGKPAVRPDGDWYPPSGIPAPTIINLRGNRRREIMAPVPDGHVSRSAQEASGCGATTTPRGAAKTFASEVVAADLDRKGRPELVFGTYGPSPGWQPDGVSARGERLFDLRLRNQGDNGNGVGIPAAPSIGDLNGDGRLEIVVRRSTTGSTSTAYRARTASACRGPPGAAPAAQRQSVGVESKPGGHRSEELGGPMSTHRRSPGTGTASQSRMASDRLHGARLGHAGGVRARSPTCSGRSRLLRPGPWLSVNAPGAMGGGRPHGVLGRPGRFQRAADGLPDHRPLRSISCTPCCTATWQR